MKYNIGDIVEIGYDPGHEFTVLDTHIDRTGQIIYDLTENTSRPGNELKLLIPYQSKEINNILFIIFIGIVLYYLMRK